eukprot:m.136958 g.136958  ORF g.136958 m.136958 type:complete len:557 (+) comp14741_c0_seq10:211-1881(+)
MEEIKVKRSKSITIQPSPERAGLDKELSSWRDTNPVARDSAIFTHAGLLSAPRSSSMFLLFTIVFGGSLIYFLIKVKKEGVSTDFFIAINGTVSCFCLWIVTRRKLVQQALPYIKFIILPTVVLYWMDTLCNCGEYRHMCLPGDRTTSRNLACGFGAAECITITILQVVLLFKEFGNIHLVSVMGLLGVLYIIAATDLGRDYATMAVFLIIGIMLLFFTFLFLYRRYKAFQWALTLIQEDKDAYDDAWRHFEHDPKLFQLEGTIKKLSAIIDSKARKDKSIRKPLQPATRLSLLYTIADVMNPWFQSKAEKWYTQVMEAGSDWNSNIPLFIPAEVKRYMRTIEKTRRVYLGNPARVLDIVRASIVVDDIDQVVKVVEIIEKDRDVEIVRVKNRLSNSWDSVTSGGYRDLQLTVRTVGFDINDESVDQDLIADETQREYYSEKGKMFVAEVQVHLRAVYTVKNNNEATWYFDNLESSSSSGTRFFQPTLPTIQESSLNYPLLNEGEEGEVPEDEENLVIKSKPSMLESLEIASFAKPVSKNLGGHERYVLWRTVMCK